MAGDLELVANVLLPFSRKCLKSMLSLHHDCIAVKAIKDREVIKVRKKNLLASSSKSIGE